MRFCDDRSGRFDMLVSMSDKELKRLSVLQEICDQRITQSQAAQLLHISERQIRRLLQNTKLKAQLDLHSGLLFPNPFLNGEFMSDNEYLSLYLGQMSDKVSLKIPNIDL